MDSSEPGLPPLPDVDVGGPEASVKAQGLSLLTRKRTHDGSIYEDETLAATSSDPALFSGDEHESVGAEDYSRKRKKKMFTGSWWNHQVQAGREERKKEFKRNFDSGVFMGSDSEPPSSDSFTSLDDELARDQAESVHSNAIVQHLQRSACTTPLATTVAARQLEQDRDTTPRKRLVVRRHEQHAEGRDAPSYQPGRLAEVWRIIEECLDEGNENINLSGYGLSEVPPEIGQLAHLTKQPNFVMGMLESGASLETYLRLFLGNNYLRQLPLSLFSLSNLRELSLRRNKLTSLPAGIRHLVNLEKLNISGNRLSHLPFEVINLVAHHRLRELTTEPNSWETLTEEQVGPDQYEIRHLQLAPQPGLGLGHCLSRATPINQASPATRSSFSASSSSAPSLSEVVLRQLARTQHPDDLVGLMPEDAPDEVKTAWKHLDQTLREGGQQCHGCGRVIVCPGAEWIELWRVHHTYIPIRRVQCGRGCEGTATRWCDEQPQQS